MLRTAGFVDIRSSDATGAWRQTAERLIAEQDRLAEPLIELIGQQLFDDRQQKLRRSLQAIDELLLRRTLFTARR